MFVYPCTEELGYAYSSIIFQLFLHPNAKTESGD